ncbi:hypothetical protein [endosymbiont of unidentified scaly snail isolate Monju]|uniref:hypothetical protein n=1 Tax=endosymbiont of unidentified scaly snail isolate Monju TaxID=1248727 RepID=UPI0011DE1493|nr:hypothetical protein [endosymbiont of unidentified scaly snail isolate Monju]
MPGEISVPNDFRAMKGGPLVHCRTEKGIRPTKRRLTNGIRQFTSADTPTHTARVGVVHHFNTAGIHENQEQIHSIGAFTPVCRLAGCTCPWRTSGNKKFCAYQSSNIVGIQHIPHLIGHNQHPACLLCPEGQKMGIHCFSDMRNLLFYCICHGLGGNIPGLARLDASITVNNRADRFSRLSSSDFFSILEAFKTVSNEKEQVGDHVAISRKLALFIVFLVIVGIVVIAFATRSAMDGNA